MSHAKEIPPGVNKSDSLRDRIRVVIDSADRVEAAILRAEAKETGGIVPVEAVCRYCDGDGFLEKYYRYIKVSDITGCFYLDLNHFNAIKDCILKGRPRRELENVSKQYIKKKGRETSYTKGEVTIFRIITKKRVGLCWYYRVQIQGKRRRFRLIYDRDKAYRTAKEIFRKAKAGVSVLELYQEYDPKSNTNKRLEQEASDQLVTCSQDKLPSNVRCDLAQTSRPNSEIGKSEVTIMQVVNAYQEGAKNRTNGLNSQNSRRCVNQLRKVISLGLNLKLPKNKTKKEVQAAEKRAFERPVSDLTPEVVDLFMDKMLGENSDYEDIDEAEILERSESANSTFRQAKSIFARKGRKIFRRTGLVFELPKGFMEEGFLSVAAARYTLPVFHRIEGIFKELLTLRRADPDHYLARLIGLYAGLRPSEIVYLKKEQIENAGYWRINIKVMSDFKPKHYHERSIKISSGLAEHILDVCRDNGSIYIISGRERTEELYRKINPHLRENFLPDARRPSYELRKFYASAANLVLGINITHNRMGHKDRTTTERHYIDKDTPMELANLYDKYAKKLFEGAAFMI